MQRVFFFPVCLMAGTVFNVFADRPTLVSDCHQHEQVEFKEKTR